LPELSRRPAALASGVKLPRVDEGLQPAIRASDAERDATIIRLRDAMAEGRLTLDDFSERTDTALTALTRDQLAAVVADLPSAPAPAAIVAQTAGWNPYVVGILGSAKRTGRWRVGHEIHALSVMGECKIDLRQAVIDASVITVDALAIMGSIEVIVPEGVEVDLGGVAIMGSKEMRMGGPAPPYGAPIVRITGLALMGSIMVRNQPSLMERAWKRLLGGDELPPAAPPTAGALR
jgi:Domain of unknown function (DUF1707)/Cell wall-active antibiotics response 4TMS YvqF